MIERVHVRVSDITASRGFYGAVLAGLGWGEAEMEATGAVAFGPGRPDEAGWAPRIWLLPTPEGPVGGGHVAVAAADRATVIDAYAHAERAGARGQVVLVPPLAISAYLEDPDGHFLEVTAPLSARDAVIFALSSQLEGLTFAGVEPIWAQAKERNLVELAGETPCVARCAGVEVRVSSTADLERLAPLVDAARALATGVTVYSLVPGVTYRVLRAFTDFYGQAFTPGEALTFVERHFLPYDDGHTLVFTGASGERRMYVQGGSVVYAELGGLLGAG